MKKLRKSLRPLLNERKHFKTNDAELDAEKEVRRLFNR
jgi:hypothetical protein